MILPGKPIRAQNSETQPLPAPKSRIGSFNKAGLKRDAITEKSNRRREADLPVWKDSEAAGVIMK